MSADAEVIFKVINRRVVDTPQLMLYSMQCSSGNTKDLVILPHLVKPILDYHMCDSTQDDPVKIRRIFLPQDLHKLILHSNLAYVTPPPSSEKPLRLPTPALKSTKITPDLPSTSGGLRLGLRNGDSLVLIQ